MNDFDYWPGDSPEGAFPATLIADWVMVASDISAMAFRVYCVLRALTDIKGMERRPISLERLRAVVPAEGGGALAEHALEHVLEELEDAGLLRRGDAGFQVSVGTVGPGGAR